MSFLDHSKQKVSGGTLERRPESSSKDHSDIIKDKVMKLKQAGVIKEVF